MTTQSIPTCGEHHGPKEWRKAVFEYEDNGIVIRVPDVYAWVCPEDGEASFTPETVDELISTVYELFKLPNVPRSGGQC